MLERFHGAIFLLGLAFSLPAYQADQETQVQQHFIAAQTAQRNDDLEIAAREYRAILVLKPDFAEIQMNLGLVLHAAGKIDESAAILDKCLKLRPDLFPARMFQGINFCKLGRPAKAIPLLTRAAAEKPDDKQVRYWLGSALIAASQPDQAVAELEKAAATLRDDLDILHLLGEAYQKAAWQQSAQVKALPVSSLERRLLIAEGYLLQQEWMAAEYYYSKLLELNPVPERVHLGLGLALLRQGKIGDAAPHFQDELRIDPYSVAAFCSLAELQILDGNPGEALASLGHALAIRPEHAIAALEPIESNTQNVSDKSRARFEQAIVEWSRIAATDSAAVLGLALAHARLGKAEEALRYSQALAATPAHGETKEEPQSKADALECLRRRQFEAAAAGLRRHLKAQPQDFEARLALARSYLESREPAQALQELRRVLESVPKRAEAHVLLGRAYRELALQTLERVLTIAPDSFRAHELLGEMYEAKRQDDRAIAEYRAALAAKPGQPGLHLGIGRVHLKSIRFEEAAAEYQKELEINPYDPDANTDLGGIYLNQDQPEKAIPLLERAAKVQPSLLEVHRRLGKAYYNTGNYEKAESELKQALHEDEDGSTHYLLARAYRQLGKTQEAEAALQEVSRLKSASLKAAQARAEKARENVVR